MAEWIFWSATLLLIHTYFFYPLFLIGLDSLQQAWRNLNSKKTGREVRASQWEEFCPSVSLVVAAHNEERVISDKIRNTLSLNYPTERLDLLIGSDGSSDGTDALVQAHREERVTLSAAPRAGKTSVLNRCIPMAAGEIIVLSDANTELHRDAVAKLVRHFSDPSVGAVCGSLKLFNPTKKDYEESAYWKYESLIKLYEGKQGAVVGANGGLYAIRRQLFQTLPPQTIVDDFVIPMRILERGYKVLYEPDAIAFEETTEDYAKEFGRRTRIAAGNFQSLKMLNGLLSPLRGFRAFAFFSHKVLRWVAPALMALALLSNLALATEGILYQTALFGQALFYGLAFAGRQGWIRGSLRRAGSIANYFVSMNFAMAVGFWKFLRGSQGATWDRTARTLARPNAA